MDEDGRFYVQVGDSVETQAALCGCADLEVMLLSYHTVRSFGNLFMTYLQIGASAWLATEIPDCLFPRPALWSEKRCRRTSHTAATRADVLLLVRYVAAFTVVPEILPEHRVHRQGFSYVLA